MEARASRLHHGARTKTHAQVRLLGRARVVGSQNLALHATLAKAAGHEDPIGFAQRCPRALVLATALRLELGLPEHITTQQKPPKSRLLVAAPTYDRVHTMLTRTRCLGISVRSNRIANGSESHRTASESVAQATRACACTRLPCTHAAKEAWPQFGLSENTAYSRASVGKRRACVERVSAAVRACAGRVGRG